MGDNKRYSSQRRKGTETSSFGAPGRIGHDSSKFYKSRLYEGQGVQRPAQYIENAIAPSFLDRLFCKSSENMNEIKHHPAKLLALQMIAEFTPPRRILKALSQYVSECIITRAWVEKQSSEAKRAKWCRPIVYKCRRQHLIETGCWGTLEVVEADARARGLTIDPPETMTTM